MSQSRNARTFIVRAIFFLAFELVLVVVLMLPRNTPPVSAAGLMVDRLSGVDSGNCVFPSSCRTIGYAIGQANNGDSITIVGHLYPDVFTENLTINKSLQFIGMTTNPGLIVIDGNGSVTGQRVITVTYGTTVYMNGVTIRNGRIDGSDGAGIWNLGTLILDSSVVTGNQALATSTDDVGGGILNNGTLTVTNSTISNNSAERGGGIFNAAAASMVLSNTQVISNQASYAGGLLNYGDKAELTNVTVDGNTAVSYSAGIENMTGITMSVWNSTISNNTAPWMGGIDNAGTLTLENVTVSNNHSTGNSGGLDNSGSASLNNVTFDLNTAGSSGGGFYNRGTLTIANTIVANSTGGNCHWTSPISSQGYNLSSDLSCLFGFANTGDLNNFNPHLSPLANYGGATKTHGLFVGSPAINAGSPALGRDGCMPTDQRGVTRPQAGRCDIGAFEGTLYPIFLPLIMR